MKTLRFSLLLIFAAFLGLHPGHSQNNNYSELFQPENKYKCEDDQIEVMFIESSQVRFRDSQPVDLYSDATGGLNQVLGSLEWHQWSRFCDVDETTLDLWAENGQRNTGQPIYNLNNIYSLKIPKGHDIWQICQDLEQLPGIQQARPYPLPVEPPLPPNYQNNQGYLKQATLNPSGIDALYAWAQPGGTGSGITICDLEYSWNYNHADITKAVGSSLNTWADPGYGNDHGTAVIGQLVADNNGWGITGICYGANLLTCGTYYPSGSPFWNVPGAMALAIANLSAGDIILLEQQWNYDGSGGYVPIEWWTNTNTPQTNNAVYASIVNAVANGIHVVEAGGNGNMNTGLMTWYGNSGAIIVGAGGGFSYNNRERLSFSSYGSRFDLQGWGQNVTTTGYGNLYNSDGVNYYYTGTFNGTSSASPIVTGALACAEGYYIANVSAIPPSPAFMRNHLKTYSQPQVFGPAGNIGPRPDLYLAITALQPPSQHDWGDAPDPSYPTLSANNGARHFIDPTIYLGNTIDADPDGQPHTYALGDDNDGNDDEDGVYFTSVIMANQSATITVFASANGYLNAWFDFNFNGSWNDPGEQVFTDVPMVPGPNNLNYFVPPVPFSQYTFTRFRYSTTPGLAPTGLAPDGEVEDYEILINQEIQDDMDWGDAPDGPYPTLGANNGASHLIITGMHLGAFVDPEPDGQPSINADCDDTDCLYPSLGDDEDGVTFNYPIIPGQVTSVNVFASSSGILNAWVDQDINNSWADPGDHVLVDIPLVPGANVLNFVASPGGYTGYTYARFRFSSAVGLAYAGQAPDGEVEDYKIYFGNENGEEFDFGDAPEDPSGNYPTTLAFNGAHHSIVPGIYLGNFVDPEPDGQPGPAADCDDNDCFYPSLGDDEDGVILNTLINPGGTEDITVTASVDGFLDVWIDFNIDGDWADADDHVIINSPVTAGSTTFTYIVPANAVTGQTYARFRFRDYSSNISYDGYVQNGEVEDYSIFIEEPETQFDFGDAPEDPVGDYPTTLAFNGARHIFDPTIFMGSFVDPEPDGQPSINAGCDDTDCLYPSLGDDEDGVSLPPFMLPGSTQIITVTVSVDGFLDIWMDFNANNSWADAGEHILANSVTGAGVNTILFFVPSNAVPGQTYMRFRFRDYSGNISYDGLVQNGEVEDYAVFIGEPEEGFDFGDAPEDPSGNYPTTLAFNGAHHTIVPGIYLGNLVDPEPDGQPSIGADCDDTDCLYPSLGDDEDGVTMPTSINPGSSIDIAVMASVDGFLDVWIDFNIDGDWSDANDHVFINTPLTAGPNILTFIVPANAVTGQTYARFRFRDYSSNISYDGYVQNGEVEDYSIFIEEPETEFDFGDAPEDASGNYPTTLAFNGAHHIIAPGIYLGNLVDAEPDGQPDANALCDDNDCLFPSLGDDEDGVIIPASVSIGSSVTIIVTASVDGFLDGWMDFNINSSWADAGEHIFINTPLIAGAITPLVFTVPANATAGQSFARFRFRDYSGNISYDGLVQNGEVEDYSVFIEESEVEFDFGDAPENASGNYPTTLAFNGAHHIIVPGIYLGNFVDAEPDGQPSIGADCDDTDCLYPSLGDDEDGVTWAAPVSPGSTVPVTVLASVDGYLDGWMDFNLDQDWDDADEHVFVSTFVVAGPNLLNMTIPATADTGQSFARFRFRDYNGAINYNGLVQNGEVEDYGINIVLSNIKLDVKAILGGVVLPGWNPGDPEIMDTTLNNLGLLPLTQPYNDPAAIWYYTGSEQVPVMNKADIVDWVKIELRETANGPSTATSATIVDEQAVFLLNDGSLVSLDGTSMPTSSVIPKVDVYLVIWHRNHLGIMSANPMTNLGGGVFSYDFTSGPNQAYGANAQIQIAPGYYGMISGDAEPDGQVDVHDYALWRTRAGTTGYQGEDMDLNGNVDNVDKNDHWLPNIGKGVQIP